jgi:hypothetical protein
MTERQNRLRNLLPSFIPAIFLVAMADVSFAADPAASRPTDGLREYKDTFKVQHPYDLDATNRFSESNGVYTCWVRKGDKPLRQGSGTGPRTEMRWSLNWTRGEHMWEADAMFEPGTDRTCIMQVKSNTGGEAIYLQVEKNNLYNDSNHREVLLANGAGKWFHVISAYNPEAGIGRVWINGELKITRNYRRSPDTVWYFKNGVYNTASGSMSHFKNIRFWQAPSASAAAPAHPDE